MTGNNNWGKPLAGNSFRYFITSINFARFLKINKLFLRNGNNYCPKMLLQD